MSMNDSGWDAGWLVCMCVCMYVHFVSPKVTDGQAARPSQGSLGPPMRRLDGPSLARWNTNLRLVWLGVTDDPDLKP